jgi:hypothetical protein
MCTSAHACPRTHPRSGLSAAAWTAGRLTGLAGSVPGAHKACVSAAAMRCAIPCPRRRQESCIPWDPVSLAGASRMILSSFVHGYRQRPFSCNAGNELEIALRLPQSEYEWIVANALQPQYQRVPVSISGDMCLHGVLFEHSSHP